MKKHSIWKVKTALKNNNQMTQNNFDIAIVGAGITGLSLAYFLKDTKKRIVLIEKSNALDNTTSKSTAKLSFVQQDIYQKLEKNFGYDISKLYFESQAYAISLMKKIIVENNISCDLEKSNSYLFSMEEENLKILQREKELLTCFGCKCKTAKNLEIPIPVKKAFYVEGNYTFNPVKYMQQITKIVAKKVTIYDNLMVEGIKRQENYYLLKTKNGEKC